MYRVRSLLRDARETIADMRIQREAVKIAIIVGYMYIAQYIAHQIQTVPFAVSVGWIGGLLSLITIRWMDDMMVEV